MSGVDTKLKFSRDTPTGELRFWKSKARQRSFSLPLKNSSDLFLVIFTLAKVALIVKYVALTICRIIKYFRLLKAVPTDVVSVSERSRSPSRRP